MPVVDSGLHITHVRSHTQTHLCIQTHTCTLNLPMHIKKILDAKLILKIVKPVTVVPSCNLALKRLQAGLRG